MNEAVEFFMKHNILELAWALAGTHGPTFHGYLERVCAHVRCPRFLAEMKASACDTHLVPYVTTVEDFPVDAFKLTPITRLPSTVEVGAGPRLAFLGTPVEAATRHAAPFLAQRGEA